MRKLAIFVEGQAEFITVREFLLREFGYIASIECRTLFTARELRKAPYDYVNPTAQCHFQVINVGNDAAVLTRILEREQAMWNAGYEKIVGLRDMYSEAYREKARQIDPAITQRFIDGANDTLRQKAKFPEKIRFCFAIMEVEAWFLGMLTLFRKLDARLTVEYIKTHLQFDLAALDPETAFFHPAVRMDDIYQLVGRRYDKHQGDIEALASYLAKEDYTNLLASGKCHTFELFYRALEIQA